MTSTIERSKHLAVAFLLGAVLVGGALGFTADRMMVRDRLAPARWYSARAMRDLLGRDLALSPSQRAQLDSILDQKHDQMTEVLKPVRARMDSVDEAARARIRGILTDEQRQRFDEMRRANQQNAAQQGDRK